MGSASASVPRVEPEPLVEQIQVSVVLVVGAVVQLAPAMVRLMTRSLVLMLRSVAMLVVSQPVAAWEAVMASATTVLAVPLEWMMSVARVVLEVPLPLVAIRRLQAVLADARMVSQALEALEASVMSVTEVSPSVPQRPDERPA